MQALVHKTVRKAKKKNIGRKTPIGEVWGMIHERIIAVTDNKAKLVAKIFVYSNENIRQWKKEGKN